MFLEIVEKITFALLPFFLTFGVTNGKTAPAQPSICFHNKCFQVEVARTENEREQGLMWRTTLDRDKGMLFVFNKDGEYSFWMKNTLIPLDIIWIDGQKRVLYIHANSKPCQRIICPSIIPPVKALYVLELAGGVASDIGLRTGDMLQF